MTAVARGRLALAGALAAVAGIVASDLVTAVLNARATPVQTVAEAIIVITPGHVAEALIQVVGRNDKPFLVAGVTGGIVLFGAVAGLLARRRTLYGLLVFCAMAAVALVAAMTRPAFTPYSLLPLAGGLLAWSVLLDYLVARARPVVVDPARRPPRAAEEVARLHRRGFLTAVGGVAVASVVGIAAGRLVGRAHSVAVAARRRLRLPVTRGRVPAGADTGIDDLAPWRSPNDAFYRIDTALVLPAIAPDLWRLRIHGMVDREIELTYDDLVKRRLTEDWVTICCVSNPVGGDLIGNAHWSGVRIAELLEEAGVHPDATAVKQTSKDGWTCGTPIEALTDGRNAMLAVAMNGEPLPIEHGFPVRMIVPGLYGYVSATKWVVDLEVTTFDRFSAYWTLRGWGVKGPVKTESRVEVPRSGSSVKAGQVRVGGHAWAQHTGIAKVEYRFDGDAWREAELGRVPGVDTWVQWSGTVTADRGDHTLAVRATDRSGYQQTAARADVLPDGATGWDTITFAAG